LVVAFLKPQYSDVSSWLCIIGVIGGISAIFECVILEWLIQAVGATFYFGVFGAIPFKIVEVTEQVKSIVVAATLAASSLLLNFIVVFL
jgi:hypothetical protein